MVAGAGQVRFALKRSISASENRVSEDVAPARTTVRKITSSSYETRAELARAAVEGDSSAGDERPFHELRGTLHEALGVLSVRRWFFFVPFCLAASAIFLGSLRLPRSYTASTRFERRDDPVFMNIPKTVGTGSFAYFRQTLERDITAPEYMAEVVENLGFAKDLPRDRDGNLTPQGRYHRDAIGRGLAAHITIFTSEQRDDMDLVRVNYTGSDPEIGKRLVDEVKNTYIRRTQRRIREHLESQERWYAARMEEASQRAAQAKRRLGQLELDHPYPDLTDPSAISRNTEDTNRERRELMLRRNALRIQLSAEQQLLATQPPAVPVPDETSPRPQAPQKTRKPTVPALPPSAEAKRLSRRLVEIEETTDELRTKRGMTSEHPDIQELQTEYSRVTRRLQAQIEADRKLLAAITLEESGNHNATPAQPVYKPAAPAWDSWRPERARISMAIQSLQKQIEELDTSLEINQQRMGELDAAKKGLFNNQEVFAAARNELSLAGREVSGYQEALNRIKPLLKANDMGRAVRFREEQPARGSRVPVSPKAKTIVLAALFAGLCAGVAFTILAELVDHVFRASNQVARSLGLTILETIDVIVTTADRRRRLVHRIVLTPIIIAFGLGTVGMTGAAAYFSIQSPARYEQWRRLSTTLLHPLRAADAELAATPIPSSSQPSDDRKTG